jgi:quercetin dioxygenase-like cupin family protein
MTIEAFVSRAQAGERVSTNWGELNWKLSGKTMPGAQMTFGTCLIKPGDRNPLHSHPNCEELLYIVSGFCEHRLGDETVRLAPGDVIRIPRDVPHWARALGTEPVFALIIFSTGERQAVDLEGGGVA